MVHHCAGCGLRFRTTGELTDHITSDHVERPAVAPEHGRPPRPALDEHAYTRSGWAVPPPARPDADAGG